MDNSYVVFGTNWCPDCKKLEDFLSQEDISYTFVDLEDCPSDRLNIFNNGLSLIQPQMIQEISKTLIRRVGGLSDSIKYIKGLKNND